MNLKDQSFRKKNKYILLKDVDKYNDLFQALIQKFSELSTSLDRREFERHDEITDQIKKVFSDQNFINLGDQIFHSKNLDDNLSTYNTSNPSPV